MGVFNITEKDVITDANGIITIKVKPDAQGELSKKGLSMVCATTNGFIQVPNSVYRVSINIIKRR